MRAEVDSPTYLAGLWERDGTAMVEPARLAWGLRQAVLDAGVRVYEGTEATGLERRAGAMHVRTAEGEVRARQVLLGTNAFPSLLRRLRLMTVPVYDYVLMSEPLTAEQKAAVGWAHRQGVGDAANMFHYYRLTRDDRILWGGYDAVYHYGSRIDRSLEQGRTHARLAAHSSRRSRSSRDCGSPTGGPASSTPAPGSRPSSARRTTDGSAYALGYTGLGVAATRFGADVALDLLAGEDTERTRLRWCASGRCRSRPSRCATPASSSPGGRWGGPTRGAAAATSGCATLDRAGSASTPEPLLGARPL